MKTYIILWMMFCLLLCQVVNSQSVQNARTNPSQQLKQLLQFHRVEPPSLKMPAKIAMPKKVSVIGFDIVKNMEIAKQQCPLLKYRTTLQLQGERMNNERVGLKWETTNGFDNMAFDVTRSLGDTMHFEKINFVWAHERVSIREKYQLPDNNNYNEISYYRLKLMLNDGRIVYSNIAAVKGYDNFLFAIYPNPALHNLKINLSSKEDGNAGIIVYDASGKMVKQQSSFLTKGNDVREINVSKFAPGSYIIKMMLPDKQIRTGKFVKN
jgi:hypothetical protein